jgi:hypothetical protein
LIICMREERKNVLFQSDFQIQNTDYVKESMFVVSTSPKALI